jgi:hypothetical protein
VDNNDDHFSLYHLPIRVFQVLPHLMKSANNLKMFTAHTLAHSGKFGLSEFPMLENLFQRGGFIAFRLRTVVTIWDIQI